MRLILAYALSAVLATQAFADDEGKKQSTTKNATVVRGVKITGETVNGDGNSIRANKMGEYGGGYLIAHPIKIAEKGFFYKTYEMDVKIGGFDSSDTYIGSIEHLSTDDDEVFKKFQKLDTDAVYVFAYKIINSWNPEAESSHWQVTEIYTPEEFLKAREVTELPRKIVSGDSHTGGYSRSTRCGRVTSVERYGFFGNYCIAELNIGGLTRAKGQGDGEKESVMVFNVLDEEVAKYLENSMVLGKDVEVEYSQDTVEFWLHSDYYCESVTCASEKRKFSDEELAEIKATLLKDPEFVKEVAAAIEQNKAAKNNP